MIGAAQLRKLTTQKLTNACYNAFPV